ncbi:glutathione S-transferase-like [Agrilus planipennis]|uniref:glutathione transferase n=1 Tax=Agrilus planipennis TaxID=224129 RepID=A0A1W4XNC8_AGRPL|nr:glutathione S-transferase-like [Agrilus planipennis]
MTELCENFGECNLKRIHKTIDLFDNCEVEKMAPHYKLTYFPSKAIGEPIRFLLNYGNLEFEDDRFDRENWPQLKPNMPFGQVPVLEIDGKLTHQSIAIARYLAKKVKLTGENDWEDLEIDSIVDTINDFRQKIALYHYESDTSVKESRKEILFKETIPYYMERFETIAKNNNGHMACAKLTWADMMFAGMLDYFNFMTKGNLIENYPNLQTVVDNVLNIPQIKNWIEKRPQTES